MANDLSQVERVYDLVAEEYAEKFSGEHEQKPKDREVLQRFSEELAGRGPVWDLGCGPGQTAAYLRRLGVEISGLDLSERLLTQARRLHPKIPFRKGNLLDLDFDDNSIAGVVAFYAIVHFTEEQVGKALCEVERVLRPGGVFLLTYHVGEGTLHVDEFLGKCVDIDFTFFSTAFLLRSLEESGFGGIDVIERGPYPGVEYESRRAYVFARKPDAT